MDDSCDDIVGIVKALEGYSGVLKGETGQNPGNRERRT
jgi:hypothetical protein